MNDEFDNIDWETPRALGSKQVRATLRERLEDPKFQPLVELVRGLRKEQGAAYFIPDFDPNDGGTSARILFLLEAPGAQTQISGFVSRNNPDGTAANMLALLRDARLARSDTILWNIVPWYIGDDRQIAAARARDVEAGVQYLPRFLRLLTDLRAIVLVGRHAQSAAADIQMHSDARIFYAPHPSPRSLNANPRNRELIAYAFRQVQRYVHRTEQGRGGRLFA